MITVIDETNNNDDADDAVDTGGVISSSSPQTKSIQEESNPLALKPSMSSFPTMPNPPNNSDLMTRLKNFLPQMESANQELLSTNRPMSTDPVQLDTDLQEENDSDSDNDDDDDEEAFPSHNPLIQEVGKDEPEKETKSERASPKETKSAAPTIQMEFTMGSMNNPLMKLLADDDDDDDDDNDDDSNDSNKNGNNNANDPNLSARCNAIANLLTDSKKPSSSNETNDNLVLLSTDGGADKNAKKRPLIMELS